MKKSNRLTNPDSPQRPPTPQEREVLALLATGKAFKARAIADTLGRSYDTIKERLARLAKKRLAAASHSTARTVLWRITPAGRGVFELGTVDEAKPCPPPARRRRLTMTPVLERTLEAVRQAPDTPTSAIGRAIDLPKQATRERLLRLERLGLVARSRHTTGKRTEVHWRPVGDAALPPQQAAIEARRAEAELWIGRFGGPAATGRRLAVPRTTVDHWLVQGIPEQWRQRLHALYDGTALEAELDAGLAEADPGDAVEYWRGWLAVDTERREQPELMRRARAAQAWARRQSGGDHPAVTLVQHRHGPEDYAYLAIKRATNAERARSMPHAAAA